MERRNTQYLIPIGRDTTIQNQPRSQSVVATSKVVDSGSSYVINSTNKAQISMPYADVASAIGLTAEKIVSGNTILGIAGTGEEINNQDKTITQNGTYQADQGYTGLGTVTVNVPSGSGLDLHVSTVHLEGWVDPSTEEETDVWYLGGSEDIDFPTYLTTLHAYNGDGVDITDFVKWEVQITNNGTISNISDNVNFGMDSHNNISFLPAVNVPFILVDDWFEFRVKCTDVYGNIVYSNELEIENSTAPDDE